MSAGRIYVIRKLMLAAAAEEEAVAVKICYNNWLRLTTKPKKSEIFAEVTDGSPVN